MKSSESRSARVDARNAGFGSLWMRALRAFASAAAITTGVGLSATPALAGSPGLQVSIDSAVTGDTTGQYVSYSRAGQPVQALFRVTVVNTSPSNLNNAWLRITTLSTPAVTAKPGAFVTPVSVVNETGTGTVTCAPDPSGTTEGGLPTAVICNLASIAQGNANAMAFSLVVKTPDFSAGDPSPTSFTLSWRLQAGQGGADANPSNNVDQQSGSVALVNTPSTKVRSYLTKGGSLKVLDSFANTNVQPPAAVFAALEQNENLNSCSPQYKKCVRSIVTIESSPGTPVVFGPGAGATPLFIDLFRDKSSLKPKADITNSVLYYTDSAPGSTPAPIGPCISDGSGGWVIPPGADTWSYAHNRCLVPPTLTGPTKQDASGMYFRVLGWTNGIVDW